MQTSDGPPSGDAPPPAPLRASRLHRLRTLAVSGLGRMLDPKTLRFVFRLRRTGEGAVPEGLSDRYTAITLLGLSGEADATREAALRGCAPEAVWRPLASRIAAGSNLGDAALGLWAGALLGEAGRDRILTRLLEMRPAEMTYPTVEVAWALAALSVDGEAPVADLREQLARRLVESQGTGSGAFPHVLGGGGLRRHVACFADLVYPIQALSLHAMRTGDRRAREAAARAAELIVRRQGEHGQWWWHYDLRTGEVLEGYPVYAVHQDAMAPMALFAAQEATGTDYSDAIGRGLDWLDESPELGGGSLVDEASGLIWRKVCRREPAKLTRSLQATVSALHPALRVPGVGRLFPAVAIDGETRPYHLGWLLYAFPEKRLEER